MLSFALLAEHGRTSRMRIRIPWTVTLLRELLRYMPPRSAWRYRRLVLSKQLDGTPSPVQFWLKWPVVGPLWLRPGTSDFDTFDEVVLKQVYRDSVNMHNKFEFVIDLGANIGLSARYFAATLPR